MWCYNDDIKKSDRLIKTQWPWRDSSIVAFGTRNYQNIFGETMFNMASALPPTFSSNWKVYDIYSFSLGKLIKKNFLYKSESCVTFSSEAEWK